ncbi:MAG: hypothetical protein ACK4Y3_01360 [Dolichospermum sp.]
MIPEFTCVVREQGTGNREQGTGKTELIPTDSCMATPRKLSKIKYYFYIPNSPILGYLK